MARVTDIAIPLRGSRRRVVWLDGAEWRSTSSDALKALGLRIGHDRPAGELDADLDTAERRSARDRALNLLTYRDRTAHEILDRLMADGYPEGVSSAVVDGLRETGLVDDARFAESMAHTLTMVRGHGSVRARRELEAHGVDPDLAERAISEAAPPHEEQASAERLAHALAARPDATVERIAARLARKGFPLSLSLRVAREAVGRPLDGASDLHLSGP